jgi:hypothetical protein
MCCDRLPINRLLDKLFAKEILLFKDVLTKGEPIAPKSRSIGLEHHSAASIDYHQ